MSDAPTAPKRVLVEHLRVALAARRASRHAIERPLAQFAGMTGTPPLIGARCQPISLWADPEADRAHRRTLASIGSQPACVPMFRGDMHGVFARVHRQHGRREVLRTWGRGVRALSAEPFTLRHASQEAAA